MIPQKKILIVEDNELNRAMLREILSGEYQVLEAENGQIALDILKQNKDNIALVLLDLMMPVMDGYTFLDRKKEDKNLESIPVIMMTQGDSEADEVAALVHGATDFVPKPYRPRVILHRVASLIKLRETAAMVNQFQYDRLTGLYSKEFFYQKVRELLDRNPEREYTIVCSNIENFKLYNDIFGWEKGDRMLCTIADSMRENVGETGICGRYSADRFLSLQERKTENSHRRYFFDTVCLDRPGKIENVSIKWGVYEISDRMLPVEQMCDRALLAADSIKGQYNVSLAVYDDTLREKLLREKAITDAMESALDEGQFIVYFHPKYSLNDNCLAGAEALVRWIHPEWGFMSPGEFIPLFEKNGFITRLDQYVWEKVCIQLRDWKKKGYAPLPVSVNVSRADVYQSHLVDTLLEITEKHGVNSSCLHLEITESAYTENPGQIISTVEQLRKKGFIIEMDDFGSGYSSLNMFSQMKLDILKLDMKFIQNEISKPKDQSILNDIINMAHRLYLGVVAEGVETQEQMEYLREIGCDYVQGYYFAKPMPAAEFEELLKIRPSRHTDPLPEEKRNETGVRNLLVIDEESEYRKKVRQTFEGQYHILEASDVHDAFGCLRSHGNEEISAVILSMTLPENGAAMFLKVMRQYPVFWKVPVLASIPQCDVREDLPLVLDTDDFLCRCHPQSDLRRRIDRLVGVTSCQARECTLRDEANRDYLTGLLNRRGFQAAMISLRKEELPLAVCLFDLDNLKTVNDTFGHKAGDQMIRSFSGLLRSQTRAGDILCRHGGDEFIVILKHITSEADAEKKCKNICRMYREQITAEGHLPSCSAGIALCNLDNNSLSQWIERADQALYRAKRENKGSCCLWEEQYN